MWYHYLAGWSSLVARRAHNPAKRDRRPPVVSPLRCLREKAFARRAAAAMWYHYLAGWSSLVARRAHNPEVAGSNPAPATKILRRYPALMSRVSGKAYSVCILWSPAAHRFYIGVSEDVPKRLAQHNQGLSRWTARHRPWVLVRTEPFPNYRQARRRELELKRQKGGAGFVRKTGLNRNEFPSPGPPSGSSSGLEGSSVPLCGIRPSPSGRP
jgi:putative endonuclease